MLTTEQILANKEAFIELLKQINVPDLERFIKYLESPRADFFNKPFNTYAEQAFPGSLCEHCLAVYKQLTELCKVYYPQVVNEKTKKANYTKEDLIKIALLKDLYRAELYEAYTKNQKDEATNTWITVTAYRNKETRPIFGDIGFSSYMIAKKFVPDLSDDVVESICYSGLGNVNSIDSYNIRDNYPLVTLTTMAEIAAVHFKN